jgi:CheY-like chemotaxis protein
VGSVRVLVVDDDPDVRSLMDEILQQENFVTATAADGFEALDRLGREHFDMLVTDVRMPGMDGFELAGRARGLLPDLPVLFVSAYNPRFQFHVGDEFIRKPFRPRELVGCIYALLGRKQG